MFGETLPHSFSVSACSVIIASHLKVELVSEKEKKRQNGVVCVCVCARWKEKDMHGESEDLSEDKGGIIPLTRGKARCEKTLFYSTNHFPSDPLERVAASRCQNWGGNKSNLKRLQSHFGAARSLSAVCAEHFNTRRVKN